MTSGVNVTPEVLRKLLRCDPAAGKLFWRHRPINMFADGKQSAEHNCRAWNAKHAGMEAFTSIGSHGYRHGTIFDRNYLAHRVIWAVEHGKWPADQIDHINGLRHDNRLINLRSVSRAVNQRNQKRPITNSSGVVGVYWNKARNKWQSRIGVNGKNMHLGYFFDLDSAAAARRDAEQKFEFHENHGRK